MAVGGRDANQGASLSSAPSRIRKEVHDVSDLFPYSAGTRESDLSQRPAHFVTVSLLTNSEARIRKAGYRDAPKKTMIVSRVRAQAITCV